jgi:hypothetical protein
LKKGGQGAHNWGKEGEQDVRHGTRVFQDRKGRSEGKVVIKGEDTPVEGVTAPLKTEGETVETPTVQEGEVKTEGAEATKVEDDKKKKEEEEVDNTLTLDEYFKQQAEKRKNLPGAKAETAAVATTEKKKKEKVTPKPGDTLSIQEFLADRAEQLNQVRENERERGGRGRGRGGGRTRTTKQGPAPNLKDEKAFPSLSAK